MLHLDDFEAERPEMEWFIIDTTSRGNWRIRGEEELYTPYETEAYGMVYFHFVDLVVDPDNLEIYNLHFGYGHRWE